jgi:peptide deformylase
MTLEAVLYPDPVLREKAQPIVDIDGMVLEIRDLMVATLESYGQQAGGIAANQVGSALAMFTFWNADNQVQTIVNPRITESDGRWEYNEGCLSLPGVFFSIIRPDRVLLVGTDIEGHDESIEADKLFGRLFQHEMDHLEGKLILDRVPDGKKKRAALKLLAEK